MNMANRAETWLPSPVGRLLILAGLPLVDGYFLFYLRSEPFRGMLGAIIFGLTAFSGAGCLAAAISLGGSGRGRLRQISKLYLVIALGAFTIFSQQGLVSSILSRANGTWRVASGIFLVGLGFETTEMPPLQAIARWMDFDRIPKHLLLIILVSAVFLSPIPSDHGTDPSTQAAADLSEILLALLVGFVMTLLGALIGMRVRLDFHALNVG